MSTYLHVSKNISPSCPKTAMTTFWLGIHKYFHSMLTYLHVSKNISPSGPKTAMTTFWHGVYISIFILCWPTCMYLRIYRHLVSTVESSSIMASIYRDKQNKIILTRKENMKICRWIKTKFTSGPKEILALSMSAWVTICTRHSGPEIRFAIFLYVLYSVCANSCELRGSQTEVRRCRKPNFSCSETMIEIQIWVWVRAVLL